MSIPASSVASLSREAVLRELEIVLNHEIFINSSRLRRFLRYVVEETLDGRADRLKEYQVGLDVFERGRDYDQRTDPVVRVEARQLRFKLSEYYAGPGRNDEVVISLPKGGYAARFEPGVQNVAQPEPIQSPPDPAPQFQPRKLRRHFAVARIAIIAIACATGIILFCLRHYTPATNPEAQQLYLKGKYNWTKRTPESLNLAVDYFTQAIARQPNYAAAYVGLADTYNLLSEYTSMPYHEAFARARAAAVKAVELDDSLADAHRSLAFASYWGAWDAVTAEREFKRALQLSPNTAVAHHWFATFLSTQGRFDEALAEIDRAQQLDPSSSSIVADKSSILNVSGRHREAIALASQIAGSDPSFISAHSYLGRFYLEERDFTDYLREARTAALLEHDAREMELISAGEKAFQTAGGPAMLQAILGVQERYAQQSTSRNYEVATTCELLGDDAKALDYLEAALAKRETSLLALRMDSVFRSLHGTPRFEKILSQVRPAQDLHG